MRTMAFAIHGQKTMDMIEGMKVSLTRGVASNKELERTRSTQTAVGPRRSIQCWTERGTERLRIRGSEPRGSSKPLVAARDETAQRESRSRRGLSTWSVFWELARPSSRDGWRGLGHLLPISFLVARPLCGNSR